MSKENSIIRFNNKLENSKRPMQLYKRLGHAKLKIKMFLYKVFFVLL